MQNCFCRSLPAVPLPHFAAIPRHYSTPAGPGATSFANRRELKNGGEFQLVSERSAAGLILLIVSRPERSVYHKQLHSILSSLLHRQTATTPLGRIQDHRRGQSTTVRPTLLTPILTWANSPHRDPHAGNLPGDPWLRAPTWPFKHLFEVTASASPV